MKHIALLLTAFTAFVFVITSCQSNASSSEHSADSLKMMEDSAGYTTASFPDSMQNFGTVDKGKQVKIVFHVQNTGTKPLLIASAKPSCGCTVADFTKSPIEPGKSGEINASFDSNHGSPGQVRKTITVVTNTSPKHNMLIFTGEVKAGETASK